MSNIVSWSYSALKDYETCPYRTKLKGDKAPTLPFEKNRGTLVHEYAEQYVKGDLSVMPRELHKFEDLFNQYRAQFQQGGITCEEEWGFDEAWDPVPWYEAWLRVKTDLCWRVDEAHVVVEDWKTGKSFMNSVPHMWQAQLYALAVFMRFSEVEVCECKFRYLDEGKTMSKIFTREKDGVRLYKGFEPRVKRMFEDEELKPKANRGNCRYCPYGVTNGSSACGYAIPWE